MDVISEDFVEESPSVGLLAFDGVAGAGESPLDDEVFFANKEAIQLEEVGTDNADPIVADDESSLETSLVNKESDVGSSTESYGTFKPAKTGSVVAKHLSLDERRIIRHTQRLQFKELESGLKGRAQMTSQCVNYVEKQLKRANEIKRTYCRVWGKSIKQVEGHLGSGVSTYFKVLVWLLKINVLCMFLGLGLVVGPGWYMADHHGHTEDNLFNKDDLKCTNPKFVNGTGFHVDAVNSVLQLLTGTGWMESTAMFYGWYPTSNLTRNVKGKEKTLYNFSLAYFTVGISYFLISLLLMLANLSKLFNKSAAEQMESKPYSNVVFTWDYSLNNIETTRLKSVTVIQSLREDLDEDAQEDVKRDLKTKIGLFFLRIFTNGICVAAMIGTVYLYVHEILTDGNESRANETNSCGKLVHEVVDAIDIGNISDINVTEQFAAVWNTYSASIIVSGSNVVFPVFFQLVGNLEMYQFQSTRIGVTLFRMFIMKLFSVSTFLYILYKAAGPSGGNTEDWQTPHNTLFYNCWEDYIASQLYQLIMIDFIIFCTTLLLSEVLRGVLVTRVSFFRDKLGLTKSEFNIPKEILNLVYKQMIFWSAFYFAPLLPVMAVIEVTVIFYLKKWSAISNVIPPKTVVLNNQSTFTINALFLISLLIVFVFIGLIIFNFHPSTTCGPFRGQASFTESFSSVIDQSGVFKRYIIDNVRTTSVFIILVILVALVVYYYHSLANSRNVTIRLLREQVRNEIADKKFLLDLAQDKGPKPQEITESKAKGKPTDKRNNLRRQSSRIHGFANPVLT